MNDRIRTIPQLCDVRCANAQWGAWIAKRGPALTEFRRPVDGQRPRAEAEVPKCSHRREPAPPQLAKDPRNVAGGRHGPSPRIVWRNSGSESRSTCQFRQTPASRVRQTAVSSSDPAELRHSRQSIDAFSRSPRRPRGRIFNEVSRWPGGGKRPSAVSNLELDPGSEADRGTNFSDAMPRGWGGRPAGCNGAKKPRHARLSTASVRELGYGTKPTKTDGSRLLNLSRCLIGVAPAGFVAGKTQQRRKRVPTQSSRWISHPQLSIDSHVPGRARAASSLARVPGFSRTWPFVPKGRYGAPGPAKTR